MRAEQDTGLIGTLVYSLVHPGPKVDDALRESLLTSRGRLTAPELSIACAQRFGTDALPLLLEYQAIARRDGHDDLSEVSAVITHLGGTPAHDLPNERVVEWIATQWNVGTRILELA